MGESYQRPVMEALEGRCFLSGAAIPIQLHKLPKGTNFPGNLTVTANGDVWFTCGLAAEVGYIAPGGKVHLISTASVSSHGISSLTVGPDGNVWFAEFWNNDVGEITAKGQILTYSLGTTYGPQSITLGPDGNLWLATFDNYVGRINSVGNGQADVTWFQHSGEGIQQIISWDGSLYLEETDEIGEISTAGVFSSTPISLPAGETLQDLCVGPDGNLWFTDSGTPGDVVGYLTPAGAVVDYPVSATLGDLSGISRGGKGNLFFRQGNYLEEMTPKGKIVGSKNLGFVAGGGSIVATAKGTLWCAEGVLDKLAFSSV